MKNIKAIIFDFDGVLNDGVSVHHDFYSDLCKAHSIKAPFSTKEEFMQWFDARDFRPNYESLNISLKDPKNISYKEYVRQKGIPVVAGIKELIKKLKEKYVLAIVSTNDKEIIEQQLEEYGILNFFKIVMGNKEVSQVKPHPEALFKCLEQFNLCSEDAIYVGDMITDIESARNAGMKSIAVTWGWGAKEELEKANPDKIVDSPEEISKIL